jgi:DNA-binding XRE family transcriptional regulator
MDNSIERLNKLVKERLPRCTVSVDAPDRAGGTWWLDVSMARKRLTLEYRPGKGFGFFHDNASYGEGPAEIYRTPELVVRRLGQLMNGSRGNGFRLNLKDIRELYGQSQVKLARKVGVKQSAISRFEQRDEVKLSTLACVIKALGGQLEVRARFPNADVPLSLSKAKR